MSPPLPPPLAPRITRATLLLILGAAVALALMVPASAAADKVAICHATGSESNPFVLVEASAAGVYNGHFGSGHQGGDDIIPPFTYQEQQYSQNWDAAGQAIFADDCEVEGETSTTSTTTSSTTTTTTSETETTSETQTETTEVPFFGAPVTLGLGALGALGGTLLLLRRK